MKKVMAGVMVVLMLMICIAPVAQAADQHRGGFMGFIAGCCFGIRAAGAYNSGKDIHWREWCMLIPIVNIVFAIWNGIDGANGLTTADLAEQYGATYF